MHQPTAIRRIALGMVCLILSVHLVARSLGVIPERLSAVLQGRRALCEAAALACAQSAERGDLKAVKQTLKALAERNRELRSAGLRSPEGQLLVEVSHHRAYWSERKGKSATPTHVEIPIRRRGRPWARLELCFREPIARGPLGLFAWDDARMVLFVGAASYVVCYLYLAKVLSYLNPSSVIPQRVRNTLNTLAEGLIVLDSQQRIVLANDAFARTVGKAADQLQGRSAADLPWSAEAHSDPAVYPWSEAIRDGHLKTGAVLRLESAGEGTRIFRVNSTPILDDNGACLGALASFDDVTLLEQRNATLGEALGKLKASRDLIRQQNEQLRTLATRDPLTSCFNRRALFEELEKQLAASRRSGEALSCVLVDIDHFKAVNDTHGHAAGDQVLQIVGGLLRGGAGEGAIVGRHGGEEFCLILPGGRHQAFQQADALRRAVASAECAGIHVTASFGVSDTETAPGGQRDLLEQADQALYGAKHRGRNRVVLWDSVRNEAPADQETTASSAGSGISAGCVSGLLACLGYRDPPAADHARRVADLCLRAARGLLAQRDCDLLEVAALLHDVGRLGVPDSILFKRGPLSDDEWKVLRTHERIGQEIIAAVFGSSELTQLVRARGDWFDGSRGDRDAAKGREIPLGSRLLAIAEAFDAMSYDRAYRTARTREQAFAELRRCGGTQFDPELVERVIAAVEADDRSARSAQPRAASQAAMRIGMHLEKLACALDAEDPATLSLLAGQLKDVAEQFQLDELAASAGGLEYQASLGADWPLLVRLGAELSDLCRTVQQSLMHLEPAVRA